MIGVHIDCPNYVTDLFPCLLLYNPPPPPMDNNKTNLLLFTFPGKQGNDPVPSNWLPPSATKCRRVAGSTSNQDVMSVRHHDIGIFNDRSKSGQSIDKYRCPLWLWMNERKEGKEPVEVTELFDFSTFIYYIHPPTTHAKGKLFNCHKSWEGRTEGVKHMRVYFGGTCIGIWKINSSPPAPPFDQFIRIQFRGVFILCSP